jgi:hypothetical protein
MGDELMEGKRMRSRWAVWIALGFLACSGCDGGGSDESKEAAAKGAVGASGDSKGAGNSVEAAPPPGMAPHVANPSVPQETSPFRFAEVAKESGIDYVHFSGMTDEKHYPTANGSGVAIFDADGDGLMDLYFASGCLLPFGAGEPAACGLYRNLGDGKFEDVTEKSGLGFKGYCHGIVAADFDNDGDQDVFLACYGPNRFYRNKGDGTFEDISGEAGVENGSRTVLDKETGPGGKVTEKERTLVNWASGGAPIDYDNDGDLDLYVAIHGDWWLPGDDQYCGFPERKIRTYCSPRQVRTVKHILFRNEGDLKFTDVTDEAGVGRADGHGFGVLVSDLNNDGKPDLYVANDQTPNFLFLNKGDGTFNDVTESSGAAFDIDGQAQSGMGVDGEDIDGDGLPDLIVTNFRNEYNTIYRNNGDGFFTDMTPFFGMAQDSRLWTGWGCSFADFDLDGYVDFFVTNGYVDENHPDIPCLEPPLLHRSVAVGGDPKNRRFKIATRGVGPYFDAKHNGRGAAFGDLDNDGDVDIVVSQKGIAPAVLRNDTPRDGNHWVRLVLRGTKSNRDAVGAKVKVEAGEFRTYRQRKAGASMLSTNDGRLLIGVGKAPVVDRITVDWPSGEQTVLEGVEVDQEHTIEEAGGPAAS